MNKIEIIYLCLCAISTVAVLIFYLRTKQEDYDTLIKKLEKDKENNLKLLEEGNKKINKIEMEILKCKKELNIKLFKSKKN